MARMQSFWRTVSGPAQALMRLLFGEHETPHAAPSALPQSPRRDHAAAEAYGRFVASGLR